ncbi:MAG: hypothetical protein IT190_07100 [Microbacteriaceae bacterium]|nr:hypothetical protein [Microbacteriaceae bacterium]
MRIPELSSATDVVAVVNSPLSIRGTPVSCGSPITPPGRDAVAGRSMSKLSLVSAVAAAIAPAPSATAASTSAMN